MIDFCEIPQANKGSGRQDTFELLCRDFLKLKGLNIIQGPARGADGGKDMIVSEEYQGSIGKHKKKWLVSCKHYAHSKNAVSPNDEANIKDRVVKEGCDGIICMYSTLPTNALADNLQKMQKDFDNIVYDGKSIEHEIFSDSRLRPLLIRYFPQSYREYNKLAKGKLVLNEMPETNAITNEVIYENVKAAVSVIEIEKLSYKYDKRDWGNVKTVLDEMYIFCECKHLKVRETILDYLEDISNMTRSLMPFDVAFLINQLATMTIPASYEKLQAGEIRLLKQGLEVGFSLSYYALRYLNNLAIAAEGLMLVKYIYVVCKENKLKDFLATIKLEYTMLGKTITESHWSASEKLIANELLTIFKNDLKTSLLKMPVLSDEVYKIYLKQADT